MPEEPHETAPQPEIVVNNKPSPQNDYIAPVPQPVEAVNPTPEVSQAPGTPIPPSPVIASKSKLPGWLKNKKIVIAIISAAIVLIGSGSAWAYVSAYQSPQNVITDSIINAITAKTSIYTGTLSSNSSGMDLKVEITAKLAEPANGSMNAKVTATISGKKYVVNGDAFFDQKGDIYFRVGGLRSIITEAEDLIGASSSVAIKAAIDKLVDKVDNTWIMVSTDDLKTYNPEYADSKRCMDQAIKDLKKDNSLLSEVTNLYRKHEFIVLKTNLGQQDGSFGYELKSSNKAQKAFMEGLKGTKIYKSLVACDENFKIDTSDMDTEDPKSSPSDVTIKLWVSTWSHQISKIEANSKSDNWLFKATINPQYNQKVEIDAPKASITLTELKKYIDEYTAAMNAYYQPYYSSYN